MVSLRRYRREMVTAILGTGRRGTAAESGKQSHHFRCIEGNPVYRSPAFCLHSSQSFTGPCSQTSQLFTTFLSELDKQENRHDAMVAVPFLNSICGFTFFNGLGMGHQQCEKDYALSVTTNLSRLCLRYGH